MQTKRLLNKSLLTLTTTRMPLIWMEKLKVKRRISTKKKLTSLRQSYLTCKMSSTLLTMSSNRGFSSVSSKRSRSTKLN